MTTSTTPSAPVGDRGQVWTGDRRLGWLDDAACRHHDPELFFPESEIGAAWGQIAAAKKVCRGCPVRSTCLNWALERGHEAGIWGGTTEDERRRLRRHVSSPVA